MRKFFKDYGDVVAFVLASMLALIVGTTASWSWPHWKYAADAMHYKCKEADGACGDDIDCCDPLLCLGGKCKGDLSVDKKRLGSECKGSSGCPAGKECVGGKCMPKPAMFLAGGGDGGCNPPCGGSLVCCDFESGRKCVDPEQCK